jgi:glycosyltransferase involved in cell wall biosynthesis
MLKIIVHDYAGHPFPLTLSEELSNKHEVYHLYFGNDYGPKADFKNSINKNLKIENLGKEINYNKKNFVKRFFKDIQYGHLLAKRIDEIKPDIVLSGQCPTFAQESIINISKNNNAKFIMWIQDFYSIAVENILKKKISYFSTIFTFLFKYYEKKQVRIADHLIVISSEFKYQLKKWNIENDKISFIPNWGNLKQILKENSKNVNFLTNNNLDIKKIRLIYSGTLALKHNHELILKLANLNLNIEILIIGTGAGFDKLKKNKNLPTNIKLLSLLPFNQLNIALNSADIFLAMINTDASEFSVPSKILNYLCAGKPIILSAPFDNLASQIIMESKAGRVFEPNNFNDLNSFINTLQKNEKLRLEMSSQGRIYAEKHFNLSQIAKKFENIFYNTLTIENQK